MGPDRTYEAEYQDGDALPRGRQLPRLRRPNASVRGVGQVGDEARQSLLARMQNHVRAGRGDELNAMTQFADASTLWLARLRDQVEDGTRSPSTCENYERQLRIHVLPAMGAVRLGEVTTPLVDRVIRMIKRSISPATAKTCKSVISGVMGLGPSGRDHGEPRPRDRAHRGHAQGPPRGLSDTERVLLIAQLLNDDSARRRDLPDLVFFMLATGVRIGEALAVVWSDVDLVGGHVTITSTIIRVKGDGLLRKSTQSRAGVRTSPCRSVRSPCSGRDSGPVRSCTSRCSRTPAEASATRRTFGASSVTRGRAIAQLGDLARVPQDRRHDPRRRCAHRPRCRRPARSRSSVDDPGRLSRQRLGLARGGRSP